MQRLKVYIVNSTRTSKSVPPPVSVILGMRMARRKVLETQGTEGKGLKAMLPELKHSSILPHMTHADKQKKPSLYSFMNPKDLSRLEKFKIETIISDFSFFSLPE